MPNRTLWERSIVWLDVNLLGALFSVTKSWGALGLMVLFSGMASAEFCTDILDPKTVSEHYFGLISGEGARHKLTTGVEVEAGVPKDVGVEGLANKAYEVLRAKGLQPERLFWFEPVSRSYRTRVFSLRWMQNGHEYDLKVTQDFSVRPEKGYMAVEVVSPILQNSNDAELFFEVIDEMQKLGLKAEPNHSGIHIHVGVPGLTAPELGLIGWAFHLYNDRLRDLIQFSPHRVGYVGPQSNAEIADLASGAAVDLGVEGYLERHYSEKKNRYVGMNMASFNKFGTLESRLFNSSVNPRVLRFSRHLVRKLVGGVRNRNQALLDVLVKAETEYVSTKDLFEAIGMDLERVSGVLDIMKAEREELGIGYFNLKLRTLRILPDHAYAGYVKGVLFPFAVPEGWKDITEPR